jgi:hypothetical protein
VEGGQGRNKKGKEELEVGEDKMEMCEEGSGSGQERRGHGRERRAVVRKVKSPVYIKELKLNLTYHHCIIQR